MEARTFVGVDGSSASNVVDFKLWLSGFSLNSGVWSDGSGDVEFGPVTSAINKENGVVFRPWEV